MKIIYFGYDLFSPCLEAILENKDCQIIKIFSFKTDGVVDFNDKIKALAAENKIEFTEQKVTAEELDRLVNEFGADLIFCAGYAYRIPVERVTIPAVNIHPSPLPRGRGPWPMPWAILNREETWAVSLHKLAPKIDEGDILLQREFKLEENEDITSLNQKITEMGTRLTFDLLGNFEAVWKGARAQGKGEYLPEPSDEMRTVYTHTPKEERKLIERAFPKNYIIYINENGGK